MAKLTDLIEEILKQMIDENDGEVEITRGALAERVNCVPSQITYVLSTRFTSGQGYQVESRRGGGGWIRVRRVYHNHPTSSYLMHVMHSLGEKLTQQDAQIFIRNFLDREVIEAATGQLLSAAMSDQSLGRLSQPMKDQVRCDLFRNLLIQIILTEEGRDDLSRLI